MIYVRGQVMERLKMPMVDIIEQQKEAIELEELNA